MSQLRYVLLTVTLVALVGVSALALDVPNTFVPGDLVRAADMNENFAAVETAVTALEAQVAQLQATQPVVAHARVEGDVDVTSETMMDIVVVTLDVPADGVVLVRFVATAGFQVITEDEAMMAYQIDTEAGGEDIEGVYQVVGFFEPPSSQPYFLGAAAEQAFEVTAGTHTFRAEARAPFSILGGGRWFFAPSITAVWYPAGSVDLATAIGTGSAGIDARR